MSIKCKALFAVGNVNNHMLNFSKNLHYKFSKLSDSHVKIQVLLSCLCMMSLNREKLGKISKVVLTPFREIQAFAAQLLFLSDANKYCEVQLSQNLWFLAMLP